LDVTHKLTDLKLKLHQSERSELNMKEKVEYMDKVYNELLKRMNILEKENSQYEEKLLTSEENYRKKIDELNKAFNNDQFNFDIINKDVNNSKFNDTLNKTTQSWNNYTQLDQTLNMNTVNLGFNKAMQIQNRLVELEVENRHLKEEKANLEIELSSKQTLLDKFNELKSSTQIAPSLRDELNRLNNDFKESVEEEMKVKDKKATKTIISLKEIIEQKNYEIQNKDNEIQNIKRKFEDQQIFYENKLRITNQQLEDKEKNYMRSLKELGNVDVNLFNPNNNKNSSSIDIKTFQDTIEYKDKELRDLRIKLESIKTSMKEQDNTLSDYRSQLTKVTNELNIEKQKNTTKNLEKQINKMKKDIIKKDKEVDEYRTLVEQLKKQMYSIAEGNLNKSSKGTNVIISNLESDICVNYDDTGNTNINIQKKNQTNDNNNIVKNKSIENQVESDIINKTKYNNVYDLQKKVDNINKQYTGLKERDNVNMKEINKLRDELGRYKELYETQSDKIGQLSLKNNGLNNEVISLKNKLSIMEKQVVLSGEKTINQIRELLVKVHQLNEYKTIIRNVNNLVL